MGYVEYGIDREFVERVKKKLKNPLTKERVKQVLDGVTKADLQSRSKVTALTTRAAGVLGERLTTQQLSNVVSFVIAQKIDPSNMFHLMKLWNMFR